MSRTMHHAVDDPGVVSGRPEVFADALDKIGPAGAAGVDRALRVGADDLDTRGSALQVAADAADRPPGADAGDEVGDRPAVWRQISGPVVRSCEAGFSGLWYWSGERRRRISSASRAVTE